MEMLLYFNFLNISLWIHFGVGCCLLQMIWVRAFPHITLRFVCPAVPSVKLAQKPQEPSIIKKELYETWVLGFPGGAVIKNPPAMQKTYVFSPIKEVQEVVTVYEELFLKETIFLSILKCYTMIHLNQDKWIYLCGKESDTTETTERACIQVDVFLKFIFIEI